MKPINLKLEIYILERGLVLGALQVAAGNKVQAARLLGVTPSRLKMSLKRLHLTEWKKHAPTTN